MFILFKKNKSEFYKNVITLMTGTTISQLIPIAISPLLTRLYTPEDFGIFALYASLVAIFSSIANGRYELSIVLPKKDKYAINIFTITVLISFIVSIFLFIIVLLFNQELTTFFSNEEISFWLFLVPLSVFLVSTFNSINYLNIRKKNFHIIAQVKVNKSIILVVIQLLLGYIGKGSAGLIIGQISSQFFSNVKLIKSVLSKEFVKVINYQTLYIVLKKYRSFPFYSLPGILFNILSRHYSNILVSIFFGVKTLGFYILVQRVLGLPSSFIGVSLGQVFFQKANEEKIKYNNSHSILIKTIKKLFYISTLFFGIVFFFVEDFFAIVFGSDWAVAGVYAKILIPFFYMRFITVSVSSIYSIYNKLKIELIWQFLLFIGTFIIIFSSKYYNFSFYKVLLYWSLFGFFMYLLSLLLIYNISKNKS